eukprot:TRINITY_DN7998_c0_g1_i2.p1 TRINITY_DN7998_c0_g1~~TRINITY_DN7998_c0_g1_i2.p1  ORF type:complete len:100 (+),score=18.90 TRINITY_DN7998_c0_g1_i2:58-357(+)
MSWSLERKRSLFGGAISCSFPSTFLDVSDFREVPDNQEVFTDISTERTIIVELLEYVDCEDVMEASLTHFRELASINDSKTCEIEQFEAVDDRCSPGLR